LNNDTQAVTNAVNAAMIPGIDEKNATAGCIDLD